jgi:hypothetical protein
MSIDLKYINPRMLESESIQRCGFPDCKASCCVFGAWVDEFHVQEILSNSKIIAPYMKAGFSDPSKWFNELSEKDDHSLSGTVIHTTVLDDSDHYGGTACVFMRDDYKCALQLASEKNDFHNWHFKPFYCILHPLDLDDDGRITLGKTDELLEEPASCIRSSQQASDLIDIFSEELEYLLGNRINIKNG